MKFPNIVDNTRISDEYEVSRGFKNRLEYKYVDLKTGNTLLSD